MNRFIVILLSLVLMPVVGVGLLYYKESRQLEVKRPTKIIGQFELTDSEGDIFDSSELQGKVWVADFIFTSCGYQCPMMTQKMQRLQNKFGGFPQFRMLSISVDPERDKPEILKDYAKNYQADPKKWFFLTGARDHLQGILEKEFLVVGPGEAFEAPGAITHSERFVLVDRDFKIYGYYDVLENEKGMAQLEKHLLKLLNQRF